MKNQIKFFYDLTAEKTANEWYENPLLNPTIKHFLGFLPEHPRVLDLGCGPGHESMRLWKNGATVFGVDYSEECIKIAKQRCPQCTFEVHDFRGLDDRFGSFDGVFACASFIHIEHHLMEDIFRKIKLILNHNGHMNIIVLDSDTEKILEDKSNLDVNGQKIRRIAYGYSRNFIIDAAQNAGFVLAADGQLDDSLMQFGWRSYICKLA